MYSNSAVTNSRPMVARMVRVGTGGCCRAVEGEVTARLCPARAVLNHMSRVIICRPSGPGGWSQPDSGPGSGERWNSRNLRSAPEGPDHLDGLPEGENGRGDPWTGHDDWVEPLVLPVGPLDTQPRADAV